MDYWLATATDVGQACRLGWVFGTTAALYALVVIVLMVLSAPAYHPAVPLAVPRKVRVASQWLLMAAQLPLFVAGLCGCWYLSIAFRPYYLIAFCLGAISVIAPIMLLMMLTAADWVGRSSAR
jgi:hypothetical protein